MPAPCCIKLAVCTHHARAHLSPASPANTLHHCAVSVNDKPVLLTVNPVYSGAIEDRPFTEPAPGLVSTASDVDGNNTLSAVPDTFPTERNGSVEIAANGSFTYTPAADFEGVDTFQYTITDGEYTVTGTANITVGECCGLRVKGRVSCQVRVLRWVRGAPTCISGAS